MNKKSMIKGKLSNKINKKKRKSINNNKSRNNKCENLFGYCKSNKRKKKNH